MKVALDFERPPLRAVYRKEIEVEPGDPFVMAAQAAASLQLDEAMRVRVLSVGIESSASRRPEGQGGQG